jgi:mono/diheme cytochrome c family protein
MTSRFVIGLAAVGVGTIWGAALLAQQPAKMVSSGVFSADQAKRGQAVYMTECAKCHLDDLSGGKDSPPLVGNDFLSGWKGKTVGELFDEVRQTMPFDGPGRLTPEQYADVISFILSSNKFPAGMDELAHEVAPLKQIGIDK